MTARSALIVPFPELPPPSAALPAHVTLLFPFPHPHPEVVEATREVLAGVEAFDVVFREVRRFPDNAYLAPEPAEPFAAMTHALVGRFPAWLPYGGVHDEVIPHLTLAPGGEAAVAALLPVRGRAREAVLLTELSHDVWEPRATFPFEEH